MNDHYKTLDETIASIRTECEAQLQTMRDKLLAAELEATMAKAGMKEAREAQSAAERVTTKLLTQFGLVSTVFEEARRMALQLTPKEPVVLPANTLNTEPGSVTIIEDK